jgi:hypothetical protein
MKKGQVILIVFIVLFILLRLFLVFSQKNIIFDVNEFLPGTVAFELVHGASLPLKYCLPDDHNFGSVVNGILTVPFFLLFGPCVAALKMVAILFSLGTLIIWYLLLERFFSRQIAVLVGLLFIFSPTIYTKCSVLAVGSHPESSFFTAAILFIAYFIFFDNRKKSIYFILLGVISGFGFFYSYICGITLLVLSIYWLIFDKKLIFHTKFYLFLVFALIGFSPRAYFAVGLIEDYHRFTNFFNSAFNLKTVTISHLTFKIKNFFTQDLVRLFDFEHLSSTIGQLYYAFFVLCFLAILVIYIRAFVKLLISAEFRKAKLSFKESIPLLFMVVYFLAYVFSTYAVWQDWQNAGYLVPLYPFIFTIVALGLVRLMRIKYGIVKILIKTVMVLIFLSGLYENIILIAFNKIGVGFNYKGYSYRHFGERLGAINLDDDQFVTRIKNMDFSKRKYFLQGFGWGISRVPDSDKNIMVTADEFLNKFSFGREDRLHLFKGLGRGIAQHMALYLYHQAGIMNPSNINLKAYLFFLRNIRESDEELMKYFWKGFGQGSDFMHADKIMGNYVGERFKADFYEGLGENISREDLEDTGLSLVSRFDPKYAEATYAGYKRRHAETLITDRGYE